MLGGCKGIRTGAGRREVGDGCWEARTWGQVLGGEKLGTVEVGRG